MTIEENIPLAPFTTLRIGGPSRYFIRATTEPELLEAVIFARSHSIPLFVLGEGSNLVVPDAGFPGLVIQAAFAPSILQTLPGTFQVSAGTNWNALVLSLCEQGISGMECLAGIPGLVGGAPIQNIGAYGQEVGSSIQSVRVLDLETLSFVTLTAPECHFSYRTSIFNSTHRGRYIVTAVTFRLQLDTTPSLTYADLAHLRGTDPTPLDVYHAVRGIRARKGMLIDPTRPDPDSRSAGSFFKNPLVSTRTLKDITETLASDEGTIPHWPASTGEVKLAAAWLIEHAGFAKGFTLGRAGISSRHTLALINRTGDATADDLLRLRDLIILTVEQRFGVTLTQEPVTLR